MKKSRVVGFVTGAHVIVIGGLLLSQGCGTTRAPLPREDALVMPPSQEEEHLAAPVAVDPVHRPAAMPPSAPSADPVVVTAPTATTTYVVAKGDVLSVIARRYDVSVQDILRINNLSNPDVIRVGQQLELPGALDLDQPRTVSPRQETVDAGLTGGGDRYVVQGGDSLSVIAQRYGVNVQSLMRANNITDANRIQVGQELVIPAGERRPDVSAPAVEAPASGVSSLASPAVDPVSVDLPVVQDEPSAGLLPPAPAEQGVGQSYTVEIGDDLLSVASEFNVSIADLRAANNLDSDILVPGRTLVIPDAE